MRHWFPHSQAEVKQIERAETQRLLDQADDFAFSRVRRKLELEDHSPRHFPKDD